MLKPKETRGVSDTVGREGLAKRAIEIMVTDYVIFWVVGPAIMICLLWVFSYAHRNDQKLWAECEARGSMTIRTRSGLVCVGKPSITQK